MVVISQALETVIALIIFIGLVFVFFNIFGASDCDKFANTTAVDLTNAINKVALEKGVSPWSGSGVPTDDKTDYYTTVPIRLCQKNPLQTFAAQFLPQPPEYILTYETMPESGYAWSETLPFSGGEAQSLFNYAIMKYGIKALTVVSKCVVKASTWVGGKIVNLIWKGGTTLLQLKFDRFVEEHNNNILVKIFLSRFASSLDEEAVRPGLEDWLNPNYLSKEKDKNLIVAVDYLMRAEDMSKEEALAELGVLESKIDPITNKMTLVFTKDGRAIVTPEYRDFMFNYIENFGDDVETARGMFYIPSKFESIENFKQNYWLPFKNWVLDSRFKKLIDWPKKEYDKIKGGLNKWFNYKDGMLDSSETPQQIGAFKNLAMFHTDEIRQQMMEESDEFIPTLNKMYSDLKIDRVINTADEISDGDVIRFINNYQRYAVANNLMYLVGRDPEMVESAAYVTMGREIEQSAEAVANSANPHADFFEIQKYAISWDNLGPAEKQAYVDKFGLDLTQAKEIYETARTSLLDKGVLDSNQVFESGVFRGDWLVDEADKVKSEMFIYQRKNVADFFLTPIISDESFVKFQAVTQLYGRIKRGVFIDLNRIGQPKDPVTGLVPVSMAQYNLIPSPYSLKESLKAASEIKPGGCAPQSICEIRRGVVSGPTETSSAFLLDRKVNSSISVKLWRPKPDWTARVPVGINTALFYTSVSENPRFHVMGPCFATAKVWKKGDTVFVDIENQPSKKCDVSNCSQPSVSLYTGGTLYTPSSLPIIGPIPSFGITIPNITIHAELSSVDTPNYCYADEEYIWGNDDGPSAPLYYGGFASCILTCAGLTSWYSGGAAVKPCLKACGIGAIGILTANTFAATQTYRDVPSYARQETGWGYWNYQKAQDICDNIDIVSSFGSFGGLSGTKFAKAHQLTTKIGSALGKVSKYTGIGLVDLCYAIILMGDSSLSWPIKTAVPDNLWRKAATLNDKCMQDSAAKCVWLEKCSSNSDCTTFGNGTDYKCIDNVCQKSL